MLWAEAEEINNKNKRTLTMPMPTLIQNVMNGTAIETAAMWKATVGQLKVELERIANIRIYDDQFIKEMLDCSEAHSRLEITALKLDPELLSCAEWIELSAIMENEESFAQTYDEKFIDKALLRLEEKGLYAPEDTEEDLRDPEEEEEFLDE